MVERIAPVVFMAFNRPTHTARTFARVADARPEQLFIVTDGPRPHKPDDPEKCAAVRAILSRVDWDCDVRWNSAPINLGTRKRVQSGIDWVFGHVDSAIIVEDDCLLDPTFFRFATELLQRYQDDGRVGVISAQGDEMPPSGVSYHASRYPLLNGWATWRRTWNLYESNLETWPQAKSTRLLLDRLADPLAVAYWRGQLDRTYDGFDTWDYIVNYCCWRHDLLCLHPEINMIENIGYDAEATNTFHRHTSLGAHTLAMPFPLVHPERLAISAERDRRLMAIHYGVSVAEAIRRAKKSAAGSPL